MIIIVIVCGNDHDNDNYVRNYANGHYGEYYSDDTDDNDSPRVIRKAIIVAPITFSTGQCSGANVYNKISFNVRVLSFGF
jgi:hypothetical protein